MLSKKWIKKGIYGDYCFPTLTNSWKLSIFSISIKFSVLLSRNVYYIFMSEMLLTAYLEAYFVHTVLTVSIYGLTKRELLGRGGRARPEAEMGGKVREAAGRAVVGGWCANNILVYNTTIDASVMLYRLSYICSRAFY